MLDLILDKASDVICGKIDKMCDKVDEIGGKIETVIDTATCLQGGIATKEQIEESIKIITKTRK